MNRRDFIKQALAIAVFPFAIKQKEQWITVRNGDLSKWQHVSYTWSDLPTRKESHIYIDGELVNP
jgi:hypothetical protein